MPALLQDLRHGVRLLLGAPGFTLLAVSALAIGIGANTAVFSAINGLLLKTIPVRDPGALVRYHQETDPAPQRSNRPIEIDAKVSEVERVLAGAGVTS